MIRELVIGWDADAIRREDLGGRAVIPMLGSQRSGWRGRCLAAARRQISWALSLRATSRAQRVVLVAPPWWAAMLIGAGRRRRDLAPADRLDGGRE
jgi:hypothetical protein